jgi:hypothetical protein
VIVREMARYVAPGSALLVAAWTPELEAEIEALRTPAGNMSIDYRAIDTSDRHALEALDIPSFDHVLVLGYSDLMEPQPTDTHTLVTLLHLRRIAETARSHINVVSEMIDVRNRELAEVTRADDFVVSNKLVSLMLAQASENEHLAAIFDDLLDEKGSEIYMRPAADYVRLDTPVNFHTVADAARLSGEVAIGYRRKSREDGARGMGGVVVNPQRTELVTYSADDKVIVLARD